MSLAVATGVGTGTSLALFWKFVEGIQRYPSVPIFCPALRFPLAIFAAGALRWLHFGALVGAIAGGPSLCASAFVPSCLEAPAWKCE